MGAKEMRELELDASAWKTRDDVYDSFFEAVHAPEWHGRNFNALRDSIAAGSINDIEVPYRLIIKNYAMAGAQAKDMAADFIDLIFELSAEGVPVAISVKQ